MSSLADRAPVILGRGHERQCVLHRNQCIDEVPRTAGRSPRTARSLLLPKSVAVVLDNPPFTQNMNADLHYTYTDFLHWLVVGRTQSLLDEMQLETGCPACFCRKALEVV